MKTALLVSCLVYPSLASAQSTISTVDRYAYGANSGWIDFRPAAADGVRVMESCLSGRAYAANFGWIDFGDGSPASGHTYANNSATNYGVNLSPEGLLTGYAYAANIGWINFEQTHGKPKVDLATGHLSGSAWSSNTGWISLDTSSSDLDTTIVRPDTDSDGIGDAWEMLHFGNLSTANAGSNQDGDPQSDLAEYEADTDPEDHDSWFRILSHSHSDGLFHISTLSFTSRPSRLYRIEYSSTLDAPWTNSSLATFSPDPGTSTSKTIFRSSGPKVFVRAISIKPLPTRP